jgi:hypothetical protein
MTGQRGKRCKGSNSNSNQVANKVAKELGVEEEAGDDQKKRSVGIKRFPVQVIGNILSRFDDVKDVVRASWTCKKWRAALHHHLHTLQHEYIVDDYRLISELSDRKPPNKFRARMSVDGHNLANIESPKLAHRSQNQVFSNSRDCLAVCILVALFVI